MEAREVGNKDSHLKKKTTNEAGYGGTYLLNQDTKAQYVKFMNNHVLPISPYEYSLIIIFKQKHKLIFIYLHL